MKWNDYTRSEPDLIGLALCTLGKIRIRILHRCGWPYFNRTRPDLIASVDFICSFSCFCRLSSGRVIKVLHKPDQGRVTMAGQFFHKVKCVEFLNSTTSHRRWWKGCNLNILLCFLCFLQLKTGITINYFFPKLFKH